MLAQKKKEKTFIRCWAKANSSSSSSPSASVSANLIQRIRWRALMSWVILTLQMILMLCVIVDVMDDCWLLMSIYWNGWFWCLDDILNIEIWFCCLQIFPRMLLVSFDFSNSSLATRPAQEVLFIEENKHQEKSHPAWTTILLSLNIGKIRKKKKK